MKGKKIYEHIAEDIKNMITNKNNGGYVMPKLINLNIDHRFEQSSVIVPLSRKANPNIAVYAGQQNNE